MKKRAREAGIIFPGKTGKYNAITDVSGIEVGYSTVIYGTQEDYHGDGSNFARTGVTAILPRGKRRSAVLSGRHDLNGNGELTGTHWIDDSGFLHGPVMITNTNSVGIVRDSTSKWMIRNNFYFPLVIEKKQIEGTGYFYPVVGETWDGILNDINGFHIKEEHVLNALNNASSGPVKEGNVGGGTGMVCHDFKGGTGTSSRTVSEEYGQYTVGVLLQANHGVGKLFEIQGVSMNGKIKEADPVYNTLTPKSGTGSIIVVVATDAPLSPIQLEKLCKRVPIGIGKLGSGFENGSGDIFIAFSTANENAFTTSRTMIEIMSDDMMDPLYKAVAEAVEEAILNALFAGETMDGISGNKVFSLPQDQVIDILRANGKL